MNIKDWALLTSLMIVAVLLVVMSTTEPVVIKECDISKPISAGVEPGNNYKTWGELKYLIDEGEYEKDIKN